MSAAPVSTAKWRSVVTGRSATLEPIGLEITPRYSPVKRALPLRPSPGTMAATVTTYSGISLKESRFLPAIRILPAFDATPAISLVSFLHSPLCVSRQSSNMSRSTVSV
jgi:hypothetical protein